jgi:hypothetical protein
MNLEIHISDYYLATLATLIAERLMETRQESLNAFLSEDPVFEAKPQAKQISYPAPAEPVAEPEPAVVKEVEAKPTPAPVVQMTLDEVRTQMAALPRDKARQALTDLGFAKLSDVPADQYPRLLELAA